MREKLLTGLLMSLVGTSALAKERANQDAFLRSQEEKPLAATAEALLERGARVEHAEGRLGVPSFLWKESTGAKDSALMAMKPEEAARTHLRAYADLYRLSGKDTLGAELRNLHDTKQGPLVARFGQSVDGIEVFRNELKVVMNRDNELVAISGYLAPSQTVEKARLSAASGFRLSAQDAIASAFRDLTGVAISPRSLVAGQVKGAYTSFGFDAASSRLLTWHMEEPARAKKVFFTLPDRLEPAWYVEVNAGPKSSQESAYFSFVVSATDGALLLRNDLSSHNVFTYRVWADPFSGLPHDGPQGTGATPHPTGTPNGYQPPFTPPNFVSLSNIVFSRNDPWLPTNATQTTGNNVDAYADRAAPDGFQVETDLRASSTAPGVFDYTYDTALAPNANDTQVNAAVVNLFYVNNFLHDWFYDAGFDEASGNAQALNFGRGGLEGDSLKAEAQDYGGRNNANMSTPADGSRPRMQMYIFNGVPELKVTSPAPLAGVKDSGSAAFGAQTFAVTGELKILNPSGSTDGCAGFPEGTFTGKIALLDRGVCGFSFKALQAQNAGATAVIIANNAANQPAPGLGAGPEAAQVTIPVLSTTLESGSAWKTEVKNNGTSINLSLRRVPDLDRDGTLDNDIVAHEWGHYISNRLVGNSNGLTNNQGRSMGEGWGDFHALMMMVREEDRNMPGNNVWQGVYAAAGYTSGGGANNGFYYGIRRLPYSTDMSKNGLTLKHIANGTPLPTNHPMASTNAVINSEVHNSGEVWATMLWECYASLLNAYPFQEAQHRMKQYLVAAYKATPNAPTFLEARDALLAVALASDPSDYQRFANAFAKRGAGFGAKVPDRDSQDHIGVVESFTSGSNLEVASIRLDDSLVGCDKDGVLDVGETGNLSVKVVNTGAWTMSSFTTFVSASGATAALSFPNGNTVQVPSLQPGQSATLNVRVYLAAVSGATPRAGLTLSFNEPSLPLSSRSYAYDGRVHYDLAFSSSATENVEADKSSWTSTMVSGVPAWAQTGDATNRYFHVTDPAVVADRTLTTPWMQVAPTGDFTFSFKHRFSFESSDGAAPYWDGGVIEITLDDITWYDLFLDVGVNPGYTAFLETSDSPLSDRAAFVGLSPGFPNWVTRTVNLRTAVAGQKVRLRFRLGADGAVGAYGWDLDDITFSNITTAPFNTLVMEPSDGTVCNQRPVAIVGGNQTVPEGVLQSSGELARTLVRLEGGSSFDPDGQPLTYQWTQLSGPPVGLSSTSEARPTFIADVSQDSILSFQLVVSDGVDVSEPKQVLVGILNVNRPPVAVAVGPGTVAENSIPAVALDGSASYDADGEPLSFLWEQKSGPPVALDDANSPVASFALPQVTEDTAFEFTLVVNDGWTESARVTVPVLVTNVDMAPFANAGGDRTVPSRSLVMLRGMASDPDGDALTYQWNQVSGPPVMLEGMDTLTPAFLAPSVGTSTPLVFELTVMANGLQSSDTVVVTVESEWMPIADAGEGQTVPGRRTVVQRGMSIVPSGATPMYTWTQLMGPPVMLEGMNSATLSFVSPDVKENTTLVFELSVMANGQQATDTVAINVTADGAPVANAGSDRTVASRSVVALRGSAVDAEGDMAFFSWTQMTGPSTPTVVLENADTASPVFTAPSVTQPTALVFRLNVSANGLHSEDFVTITVAPEGMPTADAGEDLTVAGGRTVVLRGSAATPHGGNVFYSWTQVSGPAVTLHGANTPAASFTAPDMKMTTPLVFELMVMANGQPATDRVTVTVSADREPVADAGESRTVAGRKLVVLRGSASDPDGDVATYAWTQLMGPAVMLDGANTAAPAFTTPDVKVDTSLVFQLTVTANGLQATDTVALTVSADKAPVANAGSDRTVASRSTVVLRGSVEDEEGDAATYTWTQVSGPAIILSSGSTVSPTFTAPSVKEAATLVFELTVQANGLQAVDTVVITVAAEGMPTVEAGEDRTVAGRGLVVLRGSASTPDGSAATYAWSQVSGQAVTLQGGTTAVASFTAPDVKSASTLVFQLMASANGQQTTDTVVITVAADGAPVANAGTDRTVGSRSSVVLRGSAVDAEGDAASFAWTQTGGPAVALAHADSAAPSFTAPSVLTATQLEFSLAVTANGLESTDTVVITIAAEGMPTVDAGEDRTVAGRGTVVLRGTAGAPDGGAITYAWSQVSGPAVTLTGAGTAAASFLAPDVKQDTPLVFQLTASANGQQVTDTVALTVSADRAPVAQAGTDRRAGSRSSVVLRGSATDADGDALSYAWVQTGGPDVTLEHADTASPVFTAPSVTADTALTFVLTVKANGLESTDTVVITVAAEGTPTADAGEDQAAGGGTLVVLRGAASAEGVVAYTWSQVSGPSVTLTGAGTAAASFTAPHVKADTALVFQLTVKAHGQQATDTVLVTVSKSNRRPVAQGPNALTENERTPLTLDAEATDADADSLTFLWEQVGGPRVTLEGATTPRLSFTTPEVSVDTLVAFRLLVTDSDGAKSEAVTVSITVKNVNRSPVSKPRKAAGELGGQTVTLDASTSTDPDGDTLGYQWAQVSGPPVSLSSSTGAVVTFTAPSSTSAQTFVFELTVTDRDGLAAKEQVSVEVGPTPQPPQPPQPPGNGGGNGGGCSSTGGTGAGALLPLLLLAGLLAARRQRSSRLA